MRDRHRAGKYFDAGSFTPICKKAYRAMRKVAKAQTGCSVGNPAAAHGPGRKAREILEEARNTIARSARIKKDAVIFTSGATEANFVAMRLAIMSAMARGIPLQSAHAVIGRDEHPSIQKYGAFFRALGMRCAIAEPSRGKRFEPKDIARRMQKNTVFITVQYVNSENGIVQPLARIADECRAVNPETLLHTDAAQATAYYDCAPETLRMDAVTIDSGKMFGPQGAGALLMRGPARYPGLSGTRDMEDMRPGTPSSILLSGFAAAAREMDRRRERDRDRCSAARKYLAEELCRKVPDARAHGVEKKVGEIKEADWKKLAPHILYVTFPDTNHAYLATLLDAHGFAVTTGSACDASREKGLRISLIPSVKKRDMQKIIKCIQMALPTAKKG